VPVVAMDDVQAGKIATDYLIELKHKKIGMITKTDDEQGKQRLKGYINTLSENNLSFENEYIISYDTESMDLISDKIVHSGNDHKAPTAFVCYNDQIAALLIQELRSEERRVGKECRY